MNFYFFDFFMTLINLSLSIADGSAVTELRRALEEYLSVLSGISKKGP